MRPGREASGTVHLLCGLNGAGKTTLARRLEAAGAVRFSLDEWMRRLYPDVDFHADEYGPLAEECKSLIWDIATQVLRSGQDVVLDWNQWSRERRALWRGRAEAEGCEVVLHHIDVSERVAVERAGARAASGEESSHTIDEQGVRHLARLFERPSPAEGLRVLVHD